MKIQALILLLSAATGASAQTPAKPVKSKALIKCEAQITDAQAALQKANEQIAALTAERDKLAADNKLLANTDIEYLSDEANLFKTLHKEMTFVALDGNDRKGMDDLAKHAAASTSLFMDPSRLLKSASDIETDFNKILEVGRALLAERNDLLAQYKSLLMTAQSLQDQLNMANSRQQRFNNALAAYQAYQASRPIRVNICGLNAFQVCPP